MDTNHNIREDQPRNINPNETGKNEPSKALKSQEKIDIKESELGREQGQMPADEHIEDRLSQIDKGTISMQRNISHESVGENNDKTDAAKDDSPTNYANDINDTDVRDQNDSTKDWDAENSKTGRHK